jgi:UDP-N-acetyl-2-amino-2-deoxyglucuronate dehydrogenase
MMNNFAITGVGGFVAPRHLKAIKDTGNNLSASLDLHDSVGIIDTYFPNSEFFTSPERFERHLAKIQNSTDDKIKYMSICSPNYLHDSQIRLALNLDMDVICEKPLVINPYNLDALKLLEEKSGRKIYTIMQLRNHPLLKEVKENYKNLKKKVSVDLKYITTRGKWYHYSWKGDESKSGGLATNIGVHLFDLLIWVFGSVKSFALESISQHKINGTIELENADVTFLLSIDKNDLPLKIGKNTYRSLIIDGKEIEFSEGFTDLHTEVYKDILSGHGLRIDDARPSIELTYAIRKAANNVR